MKTLDINKREKIKTVLITAIITSILSILLFVVGCNLLYLNIRYKECLHNNEALIMYCNNQLFLYEDTIDYNKNSTYVILQTDNEGGLTVIDRKTGFMKIYKNGVLLQMSVDDNKMAELISYLNPKTWFGGSRTFNKNKWYTVRTEKGYKKTYEYLQNNEDILNDDRVFKIKEEYFIN